MHTKNIILLCLIFMLQPCNMLFAADEEDAKNIHDIYQGIEEGRKKSSEKALEFMVMALENNSDKNNIRFQKQQEQEANYYLEKQEYYRAWNRYHMANVYMPSALRCFKKADVYILYMMQNDVSAPIPALFDYEVGIKLAALEPSDRKSVSSACLSKIQRKFKCLDEVNSQYNSEYTIDNSTVLPLDKIKQCMDIGPDVFIYGSYCE